VHGNAILSRFELKDPYRIELPVLFDWASPLPDDIRLTEGETRLGSRFALCAEIECGGSQFTFCSAHLENKRGDVDGRVRQLQTIVSRVGATAPAAIHVIAGDFNTLGNWYTQLARITQTGRSKPWTMPETSWWEKRVLPAMGYVDATGPGVWTVRASRLYRVKLDWILLDKPQQILRHGIGDFHTSDHRPIWVDIRA
jgi:endonuclease/exonuclease/phosphatase family metal-dependent hydrolase